MGSDNCYFNWEFLLALGLEHLMAVKDNRVHQLISESIVDVCRGELFQFQDQFNSQQTIINYLRRINRKTALLIQISTEVGAITSQSDKETVRKLKMIGHYIGMSFQIIDDVLDFTSTEKKLGKPVGSDLLNGHITLPILLEMRKNPDFKLKIEQLRRDSERKEFEECIQIIRKSDSIDEAKAVSSKYLSKALNLISELPDGHPKSLLLSLTKNGFKKHVVFMKSIESALPTC